LPKFSELSCQLHLVRSCRMGKTFLVEASGLS
jgi:hypothetical protein